MSAGIDYSMGQSNFNPETGIHFGVISTHSLGEFALDDIDYDYGDATCPKCGNAAVEYDETKHGDYETSFGNMCADYACEGCEKVVSSDHAFSDEALGWSIDDGEYKVSNCLDSDAMILQSPYYTFAQFCSPCVPGAGNLDNPCDDGAKCYCFGHEWFDGDRAPYPVYSVATGTIVEPEKAAA